MSTPTWRKTQDIDETWQLEVPDPTYKSREPEHSSDIDGLRPLAYVWEWADPTQEDQPWRGHVGKIDASGTYHYENRTYKTLAQAKRYTEQRARRFHGLPKEGSNP